MTRIELVTPSLPRKYSTPELHRHSIKSNKSGRRDSNSRPSAWKADALPTELLPLLIIFNVWEWMDSNQRYREVTDLQSAAIATMRHSHCEPVEGLEPPTCWLQISCSSQLSYTGIEKIWFKRTFYSVFFPFGCANLLKNYIIASVIRKKIKKNRKKKTRHY